MQHPPKPHRATSALSAAVALTCGCLIPASFAPAVQYTVTDLGTLAGKYSYAYGLNDSGQVVGSSYAGKDGYNNDLSHPFLYSNGAMTDLGSFGGISSSAYGINASGEVVGYSSTSYSYYAFLYTGGQMLALTLGGSPGTSASQANGVNERGQLAGYYFLNGSPTHAFLYSNGVFDLGTLGGPSSYAEAVNYGGQVVGYADTTSKYSWGSNISDAFLYANGTMTDLGTLGGSGSGAFAINDRGQIVGSAGTSATKSNGLSVSHAFLYNNGSMVDLGTLGGAESLAYGINDAGQIVGYANTAANAQHAFLYSNGSMTDLNSLLPLGSGWTLTNARAINNAGQIVGYGLSPSGETHGFILSPVSAHAAWSTASGGDWATAPAWTTSAVPTSIDDAAFNLSAPSSYTVSLSAPAAVTNLRVQNDNVTLSLAGQSLAVNYNLTVAESTGQTGALTLTGGTLSATTADVAGSAAGQGGTGSLTLGPGATLDVAKGLTVFPGGSLNLAGGSLSAATLLLTTGPSQLTWTAGTLALTSMPPLVIDNSGFFGTALTLNSGMTLSTTGAVTVPAGSSVTLNGGSLAAASLSLAGTGSAGAGALVVNAGSHTFTGTATLTSGTTVAVAAGASLSVSGSLTGPSYDLNKSGLGTLTLSADSSLNSLTVSAGALNLAAGSLATSTYFNVGSGPTSSATFNQSGGSASLPFVALGIEGGTGTYTLSAGSLTSTGTYVDVGYGITGGGTYQAGTGHFIQTGGSVTITPGAAYGYALALADGAGTTGTYSLSGSASLTVNNKPEFVGNQGAGSFDQSGGTHSAYSLIIGASAPGTGRYTLSAGSLTTSFYEDIGNYGTGTFVQTGGTHTVNPAPGYALFIGDAPGATGTYSLSGTGALTVNGTAYVGYSGRGSFAQDGGTHTVGTDLVLALMGQSTGTYTLSAGNLTIAGRLAIGDLGHGTFLQTGGTNTVSGWLELARFASSTSTYSLNGGSMSAPAAYVGGYNTGPGGAGTLNVSAGSATITGNLKVYDTPGSAVNLSGGTLSVGTLDTSGNPARLNWTAGSLAFINTASLPLGPSSPLGASLSLPAGKALSTSGSLLAGANASYTLAGGTLSVGGDEEIGYAGTATATQSAGTHTAHSLELGDQGGNGTFNLAGGTFSVDSGASVAYAGTGSLVQTGGTFNVLNSNLYLSYSGQYPATYALSAGSLNVGATEVVGRRGPATFAQTGGANAAATALFIASEGGTASYSLSGTGTLSTPALGVGGTTAASGGTGTLKVSGSAAATIAGTLKVWNTPGSSVSLAGGTLTLASLDTSGNPANFRWTAGTLSFTSAPPDISPTGPLGPSVTLAPSMTLRTTTLPAIAPASTLDIAGGSFVVAAASADALRSLLRDGRVTSSAADPTHRLAYLFSGEPSAPTSLTVTLALAGDANLDGVLNADDYALLDKGFATHASTWWQGDFDYDGSVTSADYLLIDTTYGQAQGFSPGFLSMRESQFGAAYVSTLLTNVPEPSSVACLFAGVLLPRRRRRSL